MEHREPEDLVNPTDLPETIIDREYVTEVLDKAVSTPPRDNLYLAGPHGTGKTLLARTTLKARSDTITTCYIPCTKHDTQYKVLQQVYTCLTEDDLNSGYHTAQLQDRLAQQLRGADAILVLDDLAFLLDNDGNDLLYYLSRLDHTANLSIIGIAATEADLPAVLDNRTYSSLRPRHLPIEPYTADQASRILEHRVEAAQLADTIQPAALEYITARTTNVALGLHWLAAAVAHAEIVTADVVAAVEDDAVRRYRDAVLSDFTAHHQVLLDAIAQMTGSDSGVYSGTVYDRYTDLCRAAGNDPLTVRRISDFLTHLDLLNLINTTHYMGGKTGKTREIQLVPLQEL